RAPYDLAYICYPLTQLVLTPVKLPSRTLNTSLSYGMLIRTTSFPDVVAFHPMDYNYSRSSKRYVARRFHDCVSQPYEFHDRLV
ncbi:hypothetical protein ACJMK2_018839, partial [Sinanodonta woodiana]